MWSASKNNAYKKNLSPIPSLSSPQPLIFLTLLSLISGSLPSQIRWRGWAAATAQTEGIVGSCSGGGRWPRDDDDDYSRPHCCPSPPVSSQIWRRGGASSAARVEGSAVALSHVPQLYSPALPVTMMMTTARRQRPYRAMTTTTTVGRVASSLLLPDMDKKGELAVGGGGDGTPLGHWRRMQEESHRGEGKAGGFFFSLKIFSQGCGSTACKNDFCNI